MPRRRAVLLTDAQIEQLIPLVRREIAISVRMDTEALRLSQTLKALYVASGCEPDAEPLSLVSSDHIGA